MPHTLCQHFADLGSVRHEGTHVAGPDGAETFLPLRVLSPAGT